LNAFGAVTASWPVIESSTKNNLVRLDDRCDSWLSAMSSWSMASLGRRMLEDDDCRDRSSSPSAIAARADSDGRRLWRLACGAPLLLIEVDRRVRLTRRAREAARRRPDAGKSTAASSG
jgi:hypothetical protein